MVSQPRHSMICSPAHTSHAIQACAGIAFTPPQCLPCAAWGLCARTGKAALKIFLPHLHYLLAVAFTTGINRYKVSAGSKVAYVGLSIVEAIHGLCSALAVYDAAT